jgi:hypothetical protein
MQKGFALNVTQEFGLASIGLPKLGFATAIVRAIRFPDSEVERQGDGSSAHALPTLSHACAGSPAFEIQRNVGLPAGAFGRMSR